MLLVSTPTGHTMAKKRPVPEKEDPEDSSEGDPTGDEAGSDDDVSMDDEDEDLDPGQPIDGSVPFLDTFYGLASENPSERTQSAHAMLTHCLLGPNANTKDASYALKRLMNGLCSGRAGARQGYASALTSFLKIAHKMGELSKIQSEVKKEQDEMVPDIVFVREQLTKITDPKQDEVEGSKFGKKKGSEERDYLFGRLFGILSIVRSDILSPREDTDVELTSRVTCDLANDLIALHHYKKWMREPAAHAIINLLGAFYNHEESKESIEVVEAVVRKAIVPKLFESKATGFTEFSAEQLAVALDIQCHVHLHEGELPAPLNQSILSSSTLPELAKALSSTSSVVHPRTHGVWDVVWSYLMESDPSADSSKKSRIRHLRLKKSCPISEEDASGIVRALMDNVVEKALLGANTNEHGKFHATHERKALALTLVKVLGGGEHQSSYTGAFVVSVEEKLLEESILTETVVRKLFLDVIAAGAGGGSRQNSHLLKPLSSHVLESLVATRLIDFDSTSEVVDKSADAIVDRRLACAKCFLRCDPRFDARTKTTTASQLLLLDEPDVQSSTVFRMWGEYVEFLEDRILGNGTSQEAMGYIDLLLSAGKKFVRVPTNIDNTIKRILGFLMCSAFFDCSDLAVDDKPKAKKPKSGSSASHPFVAAGLRVQSLLKTKEPPKYSTRAVLSSRFYSLLADYTSFVPPRSVAGKNASEPRQNRELTTFEILSDVFQGCELLLGSGAKTIKSPDDPSTMQEEDEVEESFQPRRFISELVKKAAEASAKDDDAPRDTTHCLVSSSILATTLYLHLLSCGSPTDFDEEVDSDDDGNDDSEVIELLSDVNDALSDLLKYYEADGTVAEEGSNPVVGLAELCANVLSSNLCAGSLSRGASPKLLRDGVRHVWTGCLDSFTRPDMQENTRIFDDGVLQVLLASVGASFEHIEGDDDVEDEDEMSDDESEAEATFSRAAGEALHIDDSDNDEVEPEKDPKTSSDDESKDVEIDEGRLQSLLLEDSDADMSDNEEDILEHHAGADAALAQLIKLKQDARKAGRLARERLELSNNLRCIALFEILLTKMSGALPPEFVLKMMIPLLRLRKSLDKSLALSSSSNLGRKGGADNEKKALLEKVTSLLKSKVCKARIAKHVDRELVLGIAEELMDELRRSTSAEYASCCSACELAAIKSLSDVDDIVVAAEVYTGAVVEWTTKRTTRLQASTFEDMIQQLPGVAQMKLAGPLAEACKEARSPFLKSESFRLMTSLLTRSVDDEKLSKMGRASLQEASSSLAAAVVDALQNEDMKKTKRVRDVLKAAGKLVAFVAETSQIDPLLLSFLKEMRERLASIKDTTESSGVSNTCGKLLGELDDVLSKNETATSGKAEPVLSTKSKKKKKKKKDNRK